MWQLAYTAVWPKQQALKKLGQNSRLNTRPKAPSKTEKTMFLAMFLLKSRTLNPKP